MWFVKDLPDSVEWNVEVESLNGGYQKTLIHFSFTGKEEGDYIIVIPYSWAANKPNGGFTLLTDLSHTSDSIMISEVTYHGFVRELRDVGCNVMTIQDIKDAYTSISGLDFGYVSIHVTPNQKYVLGYTHKIDPQSCMFVNSRIPFVMKQRKTPIQFSLTTINGLAYGAPSFLERKRTDGNKIFYSMKADDFQFVCDTFIKTYNWDSSDEE